MLMAAEQPALAGHFFATAAPSNAINLEAMLLGVPGIPVPQNSMLRAGFVLFFSIK